MDRGLFSGLCFLLATMTCAAQSSQPNIVTYQYDNFRTGQNTQETTLTLVNVNVSQFGKLFSVAVDGQVYAQPLYVPGLSIAGGTHNVLIVATENDSVYAFDADSNTGPNSTPLWQASLVDLAHGATTGEMPGNSGMIMNCDVIGPQIGITSTPVIDLTTGTIYVEAKSTDGLTTYQRLHALDISTGNEKFASSPVVINSPANFTPAFNPLNHLNRPGLLLMNGAVFIAFGSNCDFSPFSGWVFAYDATTLAQQGVFNTTPSSVNGEGAIWMSGAGLAADGFGNIYVLTGNGLFSQGNPPNLSESLVKLNFSNGTLSLMDYFTAFNQSTLTNNDTDLGSGGVLLLPDQPGAHTHELVFVSKEGRVYLLDRDQLTSNPQAPAQTQPYCASCSSDPQIVQESGSHLLGGMWGTPAYWNNHVYVWASTDNLKRIALNNGLLDLGHLSSSITFYGYPGATPSISANGTSNGILWSIDSSQFGTPPGPAVLHAHDAGNISNEFWNSSQAANNRDRAGNAVKFAVPFIANGKVYVGTATEVDVYGLLNPGAPDFSLSTTPSSATVTPGSTAGYTENITATGGFAGSVSLSISGLPAGANGTFNPNPATGSSSALAITTSSTTPAGSYVFTVTGTSTSPALTHTSTATLVLQSAGPPPAIAFVRAANNLFPGSAASVSVANMVNNVGDALVVACRESAQITITSVTDTAGNSYSRIANAFSTGRESALFFAANVKGSAGNTITCNFASKAGREAIVVEEFSGVVALDGFVTASNNSATTSLPSGNLVTANANDLLVYEVNVGADNTFTAGPGYTIPAGGSNARLGMQFTIVSSQGTYATLESWSTAAPADGVFAAFQGAAGPPSPDFSLSTTPSSATVTAGSPASYTENITATGGFAGSVSLSISGLPAGASGTFNPNPATGASSALTITTSSTTPAGSYLFTVTGTSTSPALTHTSTATLIVQGPPDFSLSTTPSSATVTAGSPASYTENITATGGFAGSVSLSISGLPAGASGTFNPNPATGTSSALTITTSSSTPAGSYPFTVTGTSTSPALTHTSTATLVVQSPPPPDFSLSTTPASMTVSPGSTASYTENITATGGFAGSVSLSISGLPVGANGTFNPNPATGSSSALAITTSSNTPVGSYVFTVTGTSTSPALTHTSTATLVVQSAGPPPAIAFVRAANNLIPGSVTSVSVANMVNNVGDALVVACRESAQITITSVTDTAGNSYSRIANALSTGRESALFFAANVKGSAGNTITCNFASTTGRGAIVVEEFSGVVALDGFVTASNNTATTSLPSGNLVTANANDLLVYEVNVGADNTFTAGPGYVIPAGGSNTRLGMQFTIVSSQGTYATLENWITAAPADGVFAAFK